jgi:hypothetical protein
MVDTKSSPPPPPSARPIHASPHDWPVIEGHFVPAVFAFDAPPHFHDQAREVTRRLLAAAPQIESVHMLGCCLEATSQAPASVDLLLLAAHGTRGVKARAERVLGRLASAPGMPRLELAVRTRRELNADPIVMLLASMRSVRIGGPVLWEETPRIAADRSTAVRLWVQTRGAIDALLRELEAALAGGRTDRSARTVLRLQKNVLRLGMLEALARFNRFSLDAMRCAELTAFVHPPIALQAHAVAVDVEASDASVAAIDRAVALCGQLLARTTLIRRYISQAGRTLRSARG